MLQGGAEGLRLELVVIVEKRENSVFTSSWLYHVKILFQSSGARYTEYTRKLMGFERGCRFVQRLEPSMNLTELLESNRDRAWYFVKPGGNWGDSLIYSGAECLAGKLGLRWTDLDYSNFEPDRIPSGAGIYLHGGGGLNSWCSGHAFTNLERALRTAASLVIQGPQTCETGNPEIGRRFEEILSVVTSAEVHLFARERISKRYFDLLARKGLHVHLDHDTALHLTHSDVLRLAGLQQLPRGKYVLLVSREDNEAPPISVAARGGMVQMDPAYYASSFAHWIRIHAYASRIISNRLHSSVVGSLLQRPVDVLGGAYHKNRSIWEFSLEERGVRWCDSVSREQMQARATPWLPERIRKSWKFQRAVMWLKGVPAR